MATLLRDLRFAWAQFVRRPMLFGGVMLSLALGLGANVAIFSYADALLLRLPPVSHPQTLAEIYTHNTDPNSAYNGLYPLSYLDYKDISDRNHSLSGLAIYDPMATVTALDPASKQRNTWGLQLVSGNYFSLLGVQPALGRGFLPQEADTVGSDAVAVLAYSTWQQQFNGNRNVIGSKILLNQVPYIVVGVAPAGFDGLMTGLTPSAWVPVTMAERAGQTGWLGRSAHGMFGIGRLRPGVTLAQATADLTLVQQGLDREYPNLEKPQFLSIALPLGSEPAMFRSSVAGANVLLMVLVGLVLLIACGNAAIMLLVHSHARRREWALRSALGAGHGRLLRQGLTESILLALIAGAVGLGFGLWLAPLMLRLKPQGFPVDLQFHINVALVAYTALLALGTGIVFGIMPAWQAARTSALEGLKFSSGGSGGGRHRLRQILVAGQVAVCMLVIVGAGLCLRSLQHANAINPGFDVDHLVTAQVDAFGLGYHGDAARNYVEHLEDQLQASPGVTAVSMASVMPLNIVSAQRSVLAAGMTAPPGQQGITMDIGVVGANYFAASGTRLLEGRDFARSDLASFGAAAIDNQIVPTDPGVVVVNQALAHKFWPGRDALGQELIFPNGAESHRARVIGVAANGKYRSLGEAQRMYVYMPGPSESGILLVRTRMPAAVTEAAIRTRLLQLDPNLTGDNVQTARDFLAVLLFPVRATALVLIGFGSLVLLLALAGVYGVIAASVAQRTREFGVRMAVGAAPGQLAKEVMLQGLRLAAWGLGIGLLLSALAMRAIAGLLYNVSSLDPLAYLGAAAVLVVVALIAVFVPARRAAAVDPAVTLRAE